jgi:glutamine phosphoribosylpyrophosphate amidotransferase
LGHPRQAGGAQRPPGWLRPTGGGANGIIENFRSLLEELQAEGVVFRSGTDTEVIPHLLSRELARLVAAGRSPRRLLKKPEKAGRCPFRDP